MKRLILTTLIITLSISVFAQQWRIIPISTGIAQLGKTKTQMKGFIQKRGFAFDNSFGTVLSYIMTSDYGTYNLMLNYKSAKVVGIAWTEHIAYTQSVIQEIMSAGFTQNSNRGQSMSFINESTNKMISVILKPQNVFINIGST